MVVPTKLKTNKRTRNQNRNFTPRLKNQIKIRQQQIQGLNPEKNGQGSNPSQKLTKNQNHLMSFLQNFLNVKEN